MDPQLGLRPWNLRRLFTEGDLPEGIGFFGGFPKDPDFLGAFAFRRFFRIFLVTKMPAMAPTIISGKGKICFQKNSPADIRNRHSEQSDPIHQRIILSGLIFYEIPSENYL